MKYHATDGVGLVALSAMHQHEMDIVQGLGLETQTLNPNMSTSVAWHTRCTLPHKLYAKHIITAIK